MPFHAHRDMNMRGAASVRCRLDAAEVIFTSRAREKATVALEVAVKVSAVPCLSVDIVSTDIRLPNFDYRISDRTSRGSFYRTAEMSDLTDCGRDLIVDDDEIVIGVERKLIGVERPLRLPGRFGQRLREGARCSQEE